MHLLLKLYELVILCYSLSNTLIDSSVLRSLHVVSTCRSERSRSWPSRLLLLSTLDWLLLHPWPIRGLNLCRVTFYLMRCLFSQLLYLLLPLSDLLLDVIHLISDLAQFEVMNRVIDLLRLRVYIELLHIRKQLTDLIVFRLFELIVIWVLSWTNLTSFILLLTFLFIASKYPIWCIIWSLKRRWLLAEDLESTCVREWACRVAIWLLWRWFRWHLPLLLLLHSWLHTIARLVETYLSAKNRLALNPRAHIQLLLLSGCIWSLCHRLETICCHLILLLSRLAWEGSCSLIKLLWRLLLLWL